MGKKLSVQLRAAVIARDGQACRYCGAMLLPGPLTASRPITIDHVIPVSRGGTKDLVNLVVACYWCNHVKGDSLLEELGWILFPPRFFEAQLRKVERFLVEPVSQFVSESLKQTPR